MATTDRTPADAARATLRNLIAALTDTGMLADEIGVAIGHDGPVSDDYEASVLAVLRDMADPA